MKTCIVVPHFDHLEQFQRYLPKLTASGLPLIVVDDASPNAVVDSLAALLAGSKVDITLVRHKQNQGKGGAVTTGLRAARDAGFSHALQIDADGQHDTVDIPCFLSVAQSHLNTIVCGEPVFDGSQSKLRYYGRYLTLSLSWLESLSLQIRDAMCGFRLYPLVPTIAIIDRMRLGRRMTFDPELLVRATWAGVPLRYIPVKVVYPEGGRSHFHYFRDNVEISWMHTRLLVGMVLRLPILIGRKIVGGSVSR